MFENLTNFSKLLRGTTQIMPRIQSMKERLSKSEVEAQSASGRVLVTLSGSGTITRLEIHETLVRDGDTGTIQSEVVETINIAIRDAKQMHLKAVQDVVDELGIPGVDRILAQLAE